MWGKKLKGRERGGKEGKGWELMGIGGGMGRNGRGNG